MSFVDYAYLQLPVANYNHQQGQHLFGEAGNDSLMGGDDTDQVLFCDAKNDAHYSRAV
jgi:hypothetical protein